MPRRLLHPALTVVAAVPTLLLADGPPLAGTAGPQAFHSDLSSVAITAVPLASKIAAFMADLATCSVSKRALDEAEKRVFPALSTAVASNALVRSFLIFFVLFDTANVVQGNSAVALVGTLFDLLLLQDYAMAQVFLLY